MEIVSLSEVIESVLQILKHRLQAFNIQVTHEVVADIPPIRIDPEQLQEALINIVINACEAMEAGGVIEIRERLYQDGEGKMVMLQVQDNGPGINETIKDKIIQPFFTTKEEGTGLGLSIVTRIIEEHNGFLDIASIQGQGACFTIFLPLNREGQL
jgi:signal transduction histidine kinase